MNSLPIEKQVTSLSLSKRLKELGVEQKSLFYWVEFEHNSSYPDEGVESRTHIFYQAEVNHKSDSSRNYWENMTRGKGVDDIISAFTASELTTLFPKELLKECPSYKICIQPGSNYLSVDYSSTDKRVTKGYGMFEDNLSNGFAKTLIHLLEQGLVEGNK